jgi:hypothetical protein
VAGAGGFVAGSGWSGASVVGIGALRFGIQVTSAVTELGLILAASAVIDLG